MEKRSRALLGAAIALFSAASARGQDERGFFVEAAFGWTATRGNDVKVGDVTTISSRGLFDAETAFEALVTQMSDEWMPLVRFGYQGERWGLEGEFFRLETDGGLEGGFSQSDVAPRTEIVRMWDAWHAEEAIGASFHARNELSARSGRIDITRSLGAALSLAVGLHVAKLENERGEQVAIGARRFDETLEGASRAENWLLGPSAGLRGSAAIGGAARVGYSFSQSVLFTDIDREAEWTRIPSEIQVRTAYSSRDTVPVTDLRGTLSFDVGEHVSIGALGFVSIWYDVPVAVELSLPLEQWYERERTLVFASVGPFVKARF